MGFLRRVLGGRPADVGDTSEAAAPETGAGAAADTSPAGDPGEEAARDRALLAEDAARLADDLLQRQLRYASRSWTPPRQGGEQRAGEDHGTGSD